MPRLRSRGFCFAIIWPFGHLGCGVNATSRFTLLHRKNLYLLAVFASLTLFYRDKGILSQMTKWSQLQMKINLEKFLERLKELRGDGSVAALARRIGIKQNTFDLYIKGRRKPSVELVFSIIHNCGVSFEWLFGLSDTRGPAQVAAQKQSPLSTVHSQTRGAALAPRSDSDLLAEIRALKARVAALESQPAFACG